MTRSRATQEARKRVAVLVRVREEHERESMFDRQNTEGRTENTERQTGTKPEARKDEQGRDTKRRRRTINVTRATDHVHVSNPKKGANPRQDRKRAATTEGTESAERIRGAQTTVYQRPPMIQHRITSTSAAKHTCQATRLLT